MVQAYCVKCRAKREVKGLYRDFTAASVQAISSAPTLTLRHFKRSPSTIPKTTANAASSVGKLPMTLVCRISALPTSRAQVNTTRLPSRLMP
jgi:hypothetical protein